MATIPPQLIKQGFRFCLITKNSKIPFEKEWQKGRADDDPKLLQHLKEGGNYGVIGGYGQLRILDIDDKMFALKVMEQLKTFTIKTPGGGFHFYLLSEYDKNHVLIDDKGELRANNYMVVGPGCYAIDKKKGHEGSYVVARDAGISQVAKEKILEVIKPYMREEITTSTITTQKDDSRSAKEFGEIIKLIQKGFAKEIVFKKMGVYAKWGSAPPQYKEMTYNKAMDRANKPKKKEKEEPPTQISFLNHNDMLIEQIYNEQKGVGFAVWDGKEVKYEKHINFDGIDYVPITAQEVQKKAILLPTSAEEYGTDEELDNEIRSFVTKWLDVPNDVLQFAVWNIKRSWVYDKFHTLNYLRALGDTGMGKTRFLDTLGSIHYKPIATSGATTSAPIFRIIEKWKGTLIMDEADFSKSDEAQDIIKIINMGYEKGKWVMRCDKENHNAVDFFDPYCPKILATRKVFQDKAVESRCITQVMRGTNKKVPLNLNADFFDTAQKLRNKLLMWRFRNYHTIDVNKEIDLGLELEPRVMQIVNTFVSMFGDDTKQLEVFKTFIKKHQEELIDERKSSFAGSIVEAIHNLISNGIWDISSQDIIDDGGLTDFKGNPLKPRGLSSQLKSLGFGKSIVKKIDEKAKRCLPLDKELLVNLFKRYGYEVTVVTVDRGTLEIQNTLPKDKRGLLSNNRNHRNSVTETMDSGTVKDTLFAMFSTQQEIEIQQFLTRFPENFHASIDIMLDNLKSNGEIMESRPGFVRILD